MAINYHLAARRAYRYGGRRPVWHFNFKFTFLPPLPFDFIFRKPILGTFTNAAAMSAAKNKAEPHLSTLLKWPSCPQLPPSLVFARETYTPYTGGWIRHVPGGGGFTVPVESGVVFPLYGFCQCILSLNACVFCRYTIMQYIVSVYMQAADCTIGFLLCLDAYRLPHYCMSFKVQPAERTQVSARQSSFK